MKQTPGSGNLPRLVGEAANEFLYYNMLFVFALATTCNIRLALQLIQIILIAHLSEPHTQLKTLLK